MHDSMLGTPRITAGAGRLRTARSRSLLVRLLVLVGALSALAVFATTASAASSSRKVALIPGNAPSPPHGPDGIMPVSAYVTGRPAESFGRFSFSNVALNQITSSTLSQYDTVALIQVQTSALTPAAKAALAQFVANGGKLIIHDSDFTSGNDYSWLLPGPYTTNVGAGCVHCGASAGNTTIINSSLISQNPANSSYVSAPQLNQFTDWIGDANLLVSNDPRWFALAWGTNYLREAGAQIAYAASGRGMIIYNGFDMGYIKTTPTRIWYCNDAATKFLCTSGHPSVDWLANMWYSELTKSWGNGRSGLPAQKPLFLIGSGLAASSAGLPSNGRCVAHRTLTVGLKKLGRRGNVVHVDVYINRQHVTGEASPFTNVTLRHLQRHGAYTVYVVGTTGRRYHLIATRRYHGC